MAEGRLPTLARLTKEGVSATLQSVLPPITPPAWTSFMTGKNPGKHGIFNFVQNKNKAAYIMSYVNGGSRRSPSVFQILNHAGFSAGTMNIPFTFPPEPLNGFQVSGLDTPSDSSRFVHPLELQDELVKRFGKISHDLRFLGYMSTDERRTRVLNEMRKLDEQWTSVALYLLEKHPQDLMMFVFMSIDTVQHYFWHYMDPKHFLHDAKADARFRNAVREVYERLDTATGRIIEKLPADTTVFVVSDHGGGPVADRIVYLNRYLAHLGLLHYAPKATSPAYELMAKTIRGAFSILRSSLTSRQKIFLAQIFPKLRKHAELAYTSFDIIDWSRTKAYCSEVLAAPPSIRINLKGVKRYGIVEPAEYEKLLDFITKKLAELTDPRTGKPIIARVYRREEIYQGPFAHEGADLTLDWWSEDSLFSTQPSFPEDNGKPPVVICERRVSDKSEWGGTHRANGILIASGPAFKKSLEIENARLIDMAPTILHLFGVSVPGDMDGKVLAETFQPGFLAEHPVRTGAASGSSGQDPRSGYTAEESSKVEERLQALGYLE
jgi:predicted AlkP superfamily phosphohydrolase/phosphomutase